MADVNRQIPWMAEQQPAKMVKYVNTSTDWHLITMAIWSSKADNQKIVLQRQHGGYPTPSQLVNVQVIVGVPFSTIPFYLDLIGRMKKSQKGPPWYNQHWSKWGMHIQLARPKAWKPDIPLEVNEVNSWVDLFESGVLEPVWNNFDQTKLSIDQLSVKQTIYIIYCFKSILLDLQLSPTDNQDFQCDGMENRIPRPDKVWCSTVPWFGVIH